MELSNSSLMRQADAKAINERGIPSTLLMTRAAEHVAKAAMELAGENKSAVVFCGTGNNGGDGVAAATYLLRQGFSVLTLLCGDHDKMTADTREMERRLREQGATLLILDAFDEDFARDLSEYGVIIDAIFGIGLSRPVEGLNRKAIELINSLGVPVVSADIPSGVEADTGRILGEAVRADVTVTFSMGKIGQFAEPGCTCCGRVDVVDIGIPRDLLDRCGTGVFALCDGEVTLPRRAKISHKGNYGDLLIVGGSVGYTGAPSMCARAAVRAGAGLVHLGVPQDIYEITAVKNDEAMPFPLEAEGGKLAEKAAYTALEKLSTCNVCAVGPGLGTGVGPENFIRVFMENGHGDKATVVDASGLFHLSSHLDLIKNSAAPLVLTPHDGEFSRLALRSPDDRVSDARDFAQKYNCVMVLKGHRTIAAFPDGEVYISTHGNPGMAKGGSGDVLTGMIAAMMGQLPLKKAVTTAIYLHGYAGDLCCEEKGEYAMTATDVIEMLPLATKNILEQE